MNRLRPWLSASTMLGVASVLALVLCRGLRDPGQGAPSVPGERPSRPAWRGSGLIAALGAHSLGRSGAKSFDRWDHSEAVSPANLLRPRRVK